MTTGIRHTGTLWTAKGTRLGTATFTNETASGWQQVTFSTPIAIQPNTVYVVSYHTSVGNYPYTYYTFSSSGVDNAPLHAPSSPASGGNGVYFYNSTTAFPRYSYQASNYWVDVVFVPNR